MFSICGRCKYTLLCMTGRLRDTVPEIRVCPLCGLTRFFAESHDAVHRRYGIKVMHDHHDAPTQTLVCPDRTNTSAIKERWQAQVRKMVRQQGIEPDSWGAEAKHIITHEPDSATLAQGAVAPPLTLVVCLCDDCQNNYVVDIRGDVRREASITLLSCDV